jgi:hypothetical protein
MQGSPILKLGNTLKSKSKIGWGASISTPYQGFTLNPLGKKCNKNLFSDRYTGFSGSS